MGIITTAILTEVFNAQGVKIEAETIYDGPANLFWGSKVLEVNYF